MQFFIQLREYNFISGIAICGGLQIHRIDNSRNPSGHKVSAHFARQDQFKLINGIKIDNQFLLELSLPHSLIKTCYVGFFRNGMAVMEGVHVDDQGIEGENIVANKQ